jgi:heme/copper-type cytochrome/quinol oxidase subunit 2
MNNYSITHECIKEVRNIGHTIFHNICDGTTEMVPWGTLDWLVMIVIVPIAITVIAMLVAVVIRFKSL